MAGKLMHALQYDSYGGGVAGLKSLVFERKCGVKVDRVGETFVVEINCPCGRNYRTLFSGRDCYYKLL